MTNKIYQKTKSPTRTGWMKWIGCFMLCVWLQSVNVYAQVSGYSFAATSGSYAPLSSPTVLLTQTAASGTAAGALDDVINSTATLPFAFTFNGISYPSGTALNISTNGFITFGTAPAGGNYTPISNAAAYAGCMAPFGMDCNGGYALIGTNTNTSPTLTAITTGNPLATLPGAVLSGTGVPASTTVLSNSATTVTLSANCTSGAAGRTFQNWQGQISTQTVGSTFVIQFRGMRPYNTTGYVYNCQVILTQTTNTVQFVYGTCYAVATAQVPQIGLRGTSASDFKNLSGTNWASPTVGGSNTSTSTLSFSSTSLPVSGQTYTFTPASCTGPSAPTASATSTTTADIGWTAASPVPSVGYEYVLSTTAGSPAGSGTATTSTSLTGLTISPATTYYLWVRSSCGAGQFSGWVGPASFTSPCNSVSSYPWTEGFESLGTVGATLFPPCWSYTNISGTNSPGTYGTNDTYREPHTGTKLAYTQYSTTAWMFTPAFSFTGGTPYTFSFWMKNKVVTSPVDFVMDVAYGTTASAAGMTVSLQSAYTASNSAWQLFTYTFTPASTGTYYFGIKSTSTSFTPWYLSYDDFTVDLGPSCVGPLSVSTSGLSATNVTLDWPAASPAPSNGYQWEIRSSGLPGSGSPTDAGTTAGLTASSTALTGGVTYTAYVRSDCGGTFSNWTASAPFTYVVGENCSNTQDLDPLTVGGVGTYSGTTVGYVDDIAICRTGYPDRIFSLTVPAGATIEIWQSVNGYDSYEYLGYGGSCPGTTTISCFDDSDTDHILWTNTTGSTQTVYYVQDGYSGSGTFTLNWSIATCAGPQSLATNTITSTTANLTWVCTGCTGSFIVDYGPTGFNHTGGTVLNSGTTPAAVSPVALTGLTPSTGYEFYVRQDCGGGDLSPWSGPVSFTTLAPPPVNDFCADAIAITCGTPVTGNTSTATNDNLTNLCGAGTGAQTAPGLWYSFAGTDQLVTLSLCGSSYDTRISVLKGADCNSLVCVGGNDDNAAACGSFSLQSQVTFAARLGTTYYILVHGYSATAYGAFTLTPTCAALCVAANEDCDDAQTLTLQPYTGGTYTSGDNTCSLTSEVANPSASCGGSFNELKDVWYSFSSGGNTSLSIDFNTDGVSGTPAAGTYYYALYTGACNSLTYVSCGSITVGTPLGITVASSTTYKLRLFVSSADAFTLGTYRIKVSLPAGGCMTANPGYDAPACSGSDLHLTCSGETGTGPFTYSWTGPGGANFGGTNTSQNPTVSPAVAGDYVVVITDQGNLPCTFTQTVTVTLSAAPTASISTIPGFTPVCVGNATKVRITASGTGPWSGTLSNGQSFSSGANPSPFDVDITPTPSVNTTYTISSLNEGGCNASSLSGSAAIVVEQLPTGTITSAATINACPSDPVHITGTVTSSSAWTLYLSDDGSTPQASGTGNGNFDIIVNPTGDFSYSIASIETALCEGNTFIGSSDVVRYLAPSANLSGTDNICSNAPATLNISFSGTGPWNYTITDGSYSLSGSSAVSPATVTIPANALSVGAHTFSVSALSDALCTGSGFGTGLVNSVSPTALTGKYISSVVQFSNSVLPSAACNTEVYHIKANGIAPFFGLTYNWSKGSNSGDMQFSSDGITFVNGPFSTTANDVYIQFGSIPAGYSGYRVCVQAQSNLGNCQSTLNYCPWIQGSLSTPGPITGGATTLCTPATVSYSCGSSVGATQYRWTFPGMPDVITTNPNASLDLPAFATTGQLCVKAELGCGAATQGASRCVTLTHQLAAVGPMTAPATACPGSSNVLFSVAALAGAESYTWALPSGVTTVEVAPLSNSVHLNFPANYAGAPNVCVTAGSSCSTPQTRCKTMPSGTPATPGTVTGPASNICNSTVQYTIANVAGATSYLWTLPSGTSINSASSNGNTSILIDVSPAFVSGNLSVVASNSNCTPTATSLARTIPISGKPGIPSVITAALPSWCNGEATGFSVVQNSPPSSFSWGLSNAGSSITSGQGTNSIEVTWGTVASGTVYVTASNSCGTSSTRSQVFTSTGSCREGQFGNAADSKFNVYPNPAHDQLTVQFNATTSENCIITVTDLSGRVISSREVTATEGDNTLNMDFTQIAKGVYMLEVKSNSVSNRTRVVVE